MSIAIVIYPKYTPKEFPLSLIQITKKMSINVPSLLIGILVMLSTYLAISRFIDISNTSVKKSLAIFTAALGLLSTLWLRDNPAILREYSGKIVIAGLSIVLALLTFARKSLK